MTVESKSSRSREQVVGLEEVNVGGKGYENEQVTLSVNRYWGSNFIGPDGRGCRVNPLCFDVKC